MNIRNRIDSAKNEHKTLLINDLIIFISKDIQKQNELKTKNLPNYIF